MPFSLAEIDMGLIVVDDAYKKIDDSYIYEHLKYYFSKFGDCPLPAITVKISRDSILLVGSYIYYIAAKELGYPSIQCFIRGEIDHTELEKKYSGKVVFIDWKKEEEEENLTPIRNEPQLFFFEHALNENDKKMFQKLIVEFFETLDHPVMKPIARPRTSCLAFPFENTCAEFMAIAPFGYSESDWVRKHLYAIRQFHEKGVPIISRNGMKYGKKKGHS